MSQHIIIAVDCINLFPHFLFQSKNSSPIMSTNDPAPHVYAREARAMRCGTDLCVEKEYKLSRWGKAAGES